MSAAIDLTAHDERDHRLFGPTVRRISIVELRAIAESPFRLPSERVAARTELRRRRREAEAMAGPEALAARLAEKLTEGRPLTWRERLMAEQFELVRSREAEEARLVPLAPLHGRRGG